MSAKWKNEQRHSCYIAMFSTNIFGFSKNINCEHSLSVPDTVQCQSR